MAIEKKSLLGTTPAAKSETPKSTSNASNPGAGKMIPAMRAITAKRATLVTAKRATLVTAKRATLVTAKRATLVTAKRATLVTAKRVNMVTAKRAI